jgi:hypothetical protein
LAREPNFWISRGFRSEGPKISAIGGRGGYPKFGAVQGGQQVAKKRRFKAASAACSFVSFDLLGGGSGVLVWVVIMVTVSTAASFTDLAGDASGIIDGVAVSLEAEAKKYTTAKNNITSAAATWRADMIHPR